MWISWAYKLEIWFQKMKEKTEMEGYSMHWWGYTNSSFLYHFFCYSKEWKNSRWSKFLLTSMNYILHLLFSRNKTLFHINILIIVIGEIIVPHRDYVGSHCYRYKAREIQSWSHVNYQDWFWLDSWSIMETLEHMLEDFIHMWIVNLHPNNVPLYCC